jgi:hypothetical protein
MKPKTARTKKKKVEKYVIRIWNDKMPKEVNAALLADPARRFTRIECGECYEEATAKIDAEGRMTLPRGWAWSVTGCNWAPGVTCQLVHGDCDVRDYDNFEADEVSRVIEYVPTKKKS